MANTNDLVTRLFDSISIINDSKIQQLRYDQTVEGTIKSTARKDESIYVVETEHAQFEAYARAGEIYHENEAVYVNVPQGDFSKQKFIVGRKVVDAEGVGTAFNYRAPLDNFITFDDLTATGATVYTGDYIANHPAHGSDIDYDQTYIDTVTNIRTRWNQLYEDKAAELSAAKTTFDNSVANILDSTGQIIGREGTATEYIKIKLNSAFAITLSSGATEAADVTVTLSTPDVCRALFDVTYNESNIQERNLGEVEAALQKVETIGTTAITTAMRMSMLRAVWAQYYNYGTQEQMQERYQDRKNFYDQQKANYDKLVAEIEEKYRIPLQQVKAEYDALETEYHSREGNEQNQNLIWSWVKDDDTSFISTKLGIEASWNTYLGGFRPIDGSYGIRVRIKGRLKATATAPAQAIEDEIIFSSDEFYGNPYAYYTTYSQQVVYDISRFYDIQGIQVYFWQDHNFLDEYGSVIPWQQATDNGELIPVNSNIKMSGLRVLLGMEADEIAEETVFLYTYDSLSFGRNPADSTVTNTKTLRFCWVHQDGDTWVTVKTPEQLYQYGADIYWYHQKYNAEQNGANPPETWAGINYELLDVRGVGGLRNAFEYNATLDPDQAYERYRAAVTWGKRHVTSETLEFSNVDRTLSEQLVGDNEIILRILETDWYTEDGMSGPVLEENNEGYSITPSDGREDFFVYDENNRVIRDKYNRTYSSIDYYIQVWIRSDMGSEYVPLQVLEDDDPTFDVEWSFPEKYTMLDHFDTLNAEDVKSESLVPNIVENSGGSWRAKAVEVTQKTTRKFRIKDTWNLQYTNNTIAVDVHYHGKTYHASKEMTFGESGSDGSEFTVAIHQGTPTTLGLQPQDKFVLYATVHDSSGARVESAGFVFTWQLLSPTLITKTALEDVPSSWQNSDWNYEDNHEGYGAYTGACISGYIRDASDTNSVSYGAPPIFKVTVANAAAYPISNVRAFMLAKNKTLTVDPYNFSLPSRVEFKADGTSPIYLASPFLRWEGIQNPVYSYPEWELKQWGRNTVSNEWYAKEPPEKLRLKAQTTSSKQIDNNDNYSLASYSSTINAALTANPVNWMATDSECPIDYLNYSNTETYGSFSEQLDHASNSARRLYFTSEQSDEDEETFNARINAVEAIQTIVNSCVSRYVKAYTEYTLDPYMNSDDDLKDSWYWANGMDTDYYTWIGYADEFGYVRQAVAFTRNVYSSSLVNSWDGTLTLDEEHNALLTRMVSAGSKDAENRFTGVIMGDWADYGDKSVDIVGLYGFNAGVEMFGFRSDGTGFIGKAGKGQIQFDGRYALISNYDHTCYMNLDPILYGEDGQINDSTYMGYSPYFLYAQTPRSSPINATIETLEERVFWSKKFLEDTSNDYFIVDPNNGILMTGGIVSTYGKIGNWMISDNGLYQKHQTNDISTSHYMYLGYNSFPEDQTLATAINQENLRFSNKLTEIKGYATSKENRATTLWQIIEEVGEYFPAIFTLDPRHYMNYGWGFQWAAEYLEECLRQVGLHADDLSYRLWIWDRANLQTYFLSDERVHFVTHYHYEADGSKSGPFETGGYYTARPLLCLKYGNSTNTDMADSEPSPATTSTYYKHSVQGLYTTLWQAYQNNVVLTADYIQSVIDGWRACYDVYFNDYYDQLVEQYNMAVENDSIPASVWSDLKRRYPDFFDPTLIDHRADLQKLIAAETLKHNQIIQGLYAQDDEHRYAIFAGHYANSDPLFSVNWRGFMTARAGRIGQESPWWIHDYGLTQIKNSSIMFLGNPEAPRNLNSWIDLSFDNLVDDAENYILPANGSTYNGKKAVVANGEYAQEHMITATNDTYFLIPQTYTTTLQTIVDNNLNYTSFGNGSYADLGPEAFGEYGNFAWYAGEDGKINFGVRLDGTVYASRLQVQNIKIQGGELNETELNQWSSLNESPTGIVKVFSTDATIIFSQNSEADQTVEAPMQIASADTYPNKGIATVLAGGQIDIKNGNIECLDEDANVWRIVDRVNNTIVRTTSVTIIDGSGTFYFWINSNNKWVTTGQSFSSYSFIEQENASTLINLVAQKDAILLGGSLSGWQMTPTQIFSKRLLEDTAIESIGLDAGKNQIRIANSQIVLDGTKGVLFIGRPYITNHSAVVYTSAQIYMGAVGIQAKTQGATTYTVEASNGDANATTYIPEYTGISFSAATSTYDEESDQVIEDGSTYNPESVSGGAYLSAIVQTPITVPSRLNYPVNENYYAIAYSADTMNQGVNAAEEAYESNGIKLEFITALDSTVPNNAADYGLAIGSAVLSPLQDLSILGTPTRRWNIFAHNVFLDGDKAVPYTYVDNNDKILQDNIVAVNNKAAEALGAAAAAQASANEGIALANQGLSKANKAISQSIKAVEMKWVGEVNVGLQAIFTRNNDETIDAMTGLNTLVSTSKHTHGVDFTISNGKIQAVTTTAESGHGGAAPSADSKDIFTASTVSISGASGSQSASIAGADLTVEWDISEALETTFKNGWNAALAALTWSATSDSVSQTGAGSQSTSLTISAVGGDGKNNYNKTITLSLSNTNATAAKGGSGASGTDWDADYSLKYNGYTWYRGINTWITGSDTHYAYVSSQGTASASISVT